MGMGTCRLRNLNDPFASNTRGRQLQTHTPYQREDLLPAGLLLASWEEGGDSAIDPHSYVSMVQIKHVTIGQTSSNCYGVERLMMRKRHHFLNKA
ncbi:hypothetical protein AVEN_184201-1 [Araneus ventricosus]|uniref:Uncharacterized protein n=1 Tax=Araneus ventricosus TaxID=182803 RepID=A0A4Y2SNA0_ARAVE|nr:hypothetical protein AVEN_184201-1 [Araneus ventricosus]